ncbi:MAG: helix-turn-helix domain-containing protein [Bacteroidetes bacterium]|nr:helix-turn-helix domain-containing protein [Bacteroidota bacterium]
MKGALSMFLALFTCLLSIAQDVSTELDDLNYEELLLLFERVKTDSSYAERVARAYMSKARDDKDTIKIARAYGRLALVFNPRKNIQFADSLIYYTRHLDHVNFPTVGYMLKAFSYNKMDSIEATTRYYIEAYNMAVEKQNLYHQVFVLDNLITYKSLWGNKEEALELQRTRHNTVFSNKYRRHLQKEAVGNNPVDIDSIHTIDKIVSLQNFAKCHLGLQQLDSAYYFIDNSLEKITAFHSMNSNRLMGESHKIKMHISYFKANYNQALLMGDFILRNPSSKDNPKALREVYMFKGLSLLELGQEEQGIKQLRISDSIFDTHKMGRVEPYERILFEKLLEYYSSQGNTEESIIYLNKLIHLDSMFQKKYKYLEPALIKKFENPKLLDEKQRLINTLQDKNLKSVKFTKWILLLLLVSFIILVYYVLRQRIYKSRFEALQRKYSDQDKDKGMIPKTENEISPEVVSDILEKLKRFEKQHEYTDRDISLTSLAKTFETNSKYLSRVINLKMEKNFSQYLHDLRIDYALSEMMSNEKFRKYTIKAIAMECGYTNAESFSRAFYKQNGIYPSYYIRKINKSNG